MSAFHTMIIIILATIVFYYHQYYYHYQYHVYTYCVPVYTFRMQAVHELFPELQIPLRSQPGVGKRKHRLYTDFLALACFSNVSKGDSK